MKKQRVSKMNFFRLEISVKHYFVQKLSLFTGKCCGLKKKEGGETVFKRVRNKQIIRFKVKSTTPIPIYIHGSSSHMEKTKSDVRVRIDFHSSIDIYYSSTASKFRRFLGTYMYTLINFCEFI